MKLTKESYLATLATLKMQEKLIADERKMIRERYIEENKPCNIGDTVKITNNVTSYTGIAKSLGILKDDQVYVTSVTVGSSTKYISEPYKSIEKL
jgi:hypothetical protein